VKDWPAVEAFALTLPGAEAATSYGKPAIKVRGKMIAATTAPDPGSFVLATTLNEKELLLESDAATFWQTDHYRGWPAVLVRYGRARERVEALIERAWWDRAGVRLRGTRDRP
jgi:hypothetical protein